MPKSIDAQIADASAKIVKYEKKREALLSRKEEMALRQVAGDSQRAVGALVRAGVPLAEIISQLRK